ncbi:uncharacterized protein HMPREF1541_06039 [Cyphellophora europaea CBS 101466]|uniref:AB hydrolase-1 domain-containing protein n=1 Tax=Cyphellophora europaea (strain CBS 101466) TaxID=1220924 RepID=W2RVL8_CYPE1|nr:uncharacterized protein HMPREF1541_06039 [Cyphellophora europaea CBS 101466]ETN39813.1 hypothetical protein HMPREF1541_06039 [Cyphellophora europaea CBS 101466]
MLKDSRTNRFLIRLSIFALCAIAPISVIYIVVRLLVTPSGYGAPFLFMLDAYMLAEALFFLLVHLPRKWWINRPAAPYAPLKTRAQRREMLVRSWDATPEPRRYVQMYFYGAPVESLGREDVKRWLRWRLWGRYSLHGGKETEGLMVDEGELEEYVQYTEEVLGHEFPEGATGNEGLVVREEPVRLVRRPLMWYGIIGIVDTIAFVGMWWRGFSLYARSAESVRSFPLRPLSVLGKKSPSGAFSYWYREHTKKARENGHLPMLFVHGIGVGLHFYLPFLKDLMLSPRQQGVGMIALEVLPVCNRITAPLPPSEQIAEEVLSILQYHNWENCVLVTHSYGSALAAHMFRHAEAKARIGPMILVDPVAFSFHPPDVAWNFLRRQPTTASEWQLWYFASMDSDVARTLTRNFRWLESSLWREDLDLHFNQAGRTKDTRVTVFLSGQDIITDVNTLGTYLSRSDQKVKWYRQTPQRRSQEGWKSKEWTGAEQLEVVYLPTLNHAELFEETTPRHLLVKTVEAYTLSARKENYLLGVWGIIYHPYLGSTDRDLENKHEYDDKKSRMSETQSGGQYESQQCPNVENDSNKIRAQRRES